MTIREMLRLTAASVALFALAWFLTPLVHVNHVAGRGLTASTWGVSVGTDTRYCSLDLKFDTGGGGIDAWCQHAG